MKSCKQRRSNNKYVSKRSFGKMFRRDYRKIRQKTETRDPIVTQETHGEDLQYSRES